MSVTTTSFAKKGVRVAVKNLVFCKISQDTSNGTTYEDIIKKVPGLIEVGLTTNVSEDQLGADDNVAYESEVAIESVEVNTTIAALGSDCASYLLGQTIDDNGAVIQSNADTPPDVAMGFESKRSDGSVDYVWLYKGKFKPADKTYRTREKGTVNWQTPQISGTFVPRISDGRIMAKINSTDTGADATTVAGFLAAVYEPEITPASP